MMKLSHILLVCVVPLALCITSCGGDDVAPEPTPSPTPTPSVDTLSYDERPTYWVVTGTIDPNYSMTFTVEMDTTGLSIPNTWAVDGEDMMAAFINGSCHYVTAPVTQNNLTLFFLNAVGFDGETLDNIKTVTLKYYSAKMHHIFTIKEDVPYENNVICGSITNPYKPKWKR